MSQHPESVQTAKEMIRGIMRDPVTKLLLTNSQMTSIQFESLLAESLSTQQATKKDRHRLYRTSSKHVSRGSFNRTLIQAQNNVIRSIYTVLLLGYAGLFDDPALQPFLELSDTVRGYIQEARTRGEEEKASLRQLSLRLMEGIGALAKRQSFKGTL